MNHPPEWTKANTALVEVDLDPSIVPNHLRQFIPSVFDNSEHDGSFKLLGIVTTKAVYSGEELFIDYTDLYQLNQEQVEQYALIKESLSGVLEAQSSQENDDEDQEIGQIEGFDPYLKKRDLLEHKSSFFTDVAPVDDSLLPISLSTVVLKAHKKAISQNMNQLGISKEDRREGN